MVGCGSQRWTADVAVDAGRAADGPLDTPGDRTDEARWGADVALEAVPEARSADAAEHPAIQPLAGRIEVFERDESWTADGYIAAQFRLTGLPVHHRETGRDGDCRALEFRPGACDASCGTGFCGHDNRCHPLFESYDALGPLTVSIGALAVSVTPRQELGHYLQHGLRADLFAPGTTVTARLAHPRTGDLQLSASGVAPIEGHNLGKDGDLYVLDIDPGVPLIVRWTPVNDGSRIRLSLNSFNRAHFHPYDAIIECDTADETGQLTVSASLMAAFPRTWGFRHCVRIDCPFSILMRYRRTQVSLPSGLVELTVAAQKHFFFGKR